METSFRSKRDAVSQKPASGRSLGAAQNPGSAPFGACYPELFSGIPEKFSHTLLADILHLAPDAIISVGEDQHVLLFNRKAAQLFGYAPEEVIGQHMEMLIPEALRKFHREHVEYFGKGSARSRPMQQRGLLAGRHKDGHEFPVLAAISKAEIEGHRVSTVYLRPAGDQ